MNRTPERFIKFCKAYLLEPNGKQAAIDAGYSPRTAEVTASKLLKNPKVIAYLDKRRKRAEQKFEVKQEELLRELARIAFSDIRRYYHKDGRLKKVHELDTDAAAAMAGMDVEEIFEGRGKNGKSKGSVKKIKRWIRRKRSKTSRAHRLHGTAEDAA
jgi:phage terminase small subunit